MVNHLISITVLWPAIAVEYWLVACRILSIEAYLEFNGGSQERFTQVGDLNVDQNIWEWYKIYMSFTDNWNIHP